MRFLELSSIAGSSGSSDMEQNVRVLSVWRKRAEIQRSYFGRLIELTDAEFDAALEGKLHARICWTEYGWTRVEHENAADSTHTYELDRLLCAWKHADAT